VGNLGPSCGEIQFSVSTQRECNVYRLKIGGIIKVSALWFQSESGQNS